MSDAVVRGALAGGLAPGRVFSASHHPELLTELLSAIADGDYILVKGSRGMKMETVAEGIRGARNPNMKKGALA